MTKFTTHVTTPHSLNYAYINTYPDHSDSTEGSDPIRLGYCVLLQLLQEPPTEMFANIHARNSGGHHMQDS